MEKRLMMFLAALFLCVGTALAQTEISGTVISSEDKQPVVGASILVVGTQMGTVTDIMVISISRYLRAKLSCVFNMSAYRPRLFLQRME